MVIVKDFVDADVNSHVVVGFVGATAFLPLLSLEMTWSESQYLIMAIRQI